MKKERKDTGLIGAAGAPWIVLMLICCTGACS